MSHRDPIGRGRRAPRRAYTIIEVMMAMGVLALGATGIVAMQKVTIAGNQQARLLATANTVAQTWVERLRADATVWNQPDATELGETRWLQYAVSKSGQWFAPDANFGGVAPWGSAMADSQGQDLYATDIGATTYQQAFCTQLRLVPLTLVSGSPSYIRAEIRVFWAKGTASGRGGSGRPIACGEVSTGAEPGFGFTYVTTGFTPNVIPN
jgi:type IV pilus assembly protein PilV